MPIETSSKMLSTLSVGTTIKVVKRIESKNDVYNLYLAYHEGHGGFSRGLFEIRNGSKKPQEKLQRERKV